MARGMDRQIPERGAPTAPDRATPSSVPERPEVEPERLGKDAGTQESGRERTSSSVRDRYEVSRTEEQTLYEIGRFRTVAVQDLARHKYKGKGAEMKGALRSLVDQGLVQERTAWLAHRSGKLAVLVLTKAGKKLVEGRQNGAPEQAIYAGFVKPGEVAHDAAIYRMYHAEAARIEKAGGKIGRVVLDYELKKHIYSPLAKARQLPPLEYAKLQAQVAQENGLKVVDGKIPLPDLRIEYETADGERTQVDLELATHHYHGSHLRTKAEAGFKMYGDSSVRTPVYEDREITAAILSL